MLITGEKYIRELLEDYGLFADELRKPESCSTLVAKFNICNGNVEEAKAKAEYMLRILKAHNYMIEPIVNKAQLKEYPEQSYWEIETFLYSPVLLTDQELINQFRDLGWRIDRVLEANRIKGEYTIRRWYTSKNAGEYAIHLTELIVFDLRLKGYIVRMLKTNMSGDENNWNIKNIDVTFGLYE